MESSYLMCTIFKKELLKGGSFLLYGSGAITYMVAISRDYEAQTSNTNVIPTKVGIPRLKFVNISACVGIPANIQRLSNRWRDANGSTQDQD